MKLTFLLSAATLALGVLFLVFAVAVMGASLTDLGMVSTAGVLILFGVFGLLLHRAQVAEASA